MGEWSEACRSQRASDNLTGLADSTVGRRGESISVGGEWAMGRGRTPTRSACLSALRSASSAGGPDGGEARGRIWHSAGHAVVLGEGIVREYMDRGLSVSVCM